MLLKSRSCTHHPHICTTPTLGVGAKTCFPFRSTQKCFTPTLGVTPKICFIGFPPNQCSKFLLLSLKSSIAEKRHGLCKSYSEKRRKKVEKKWTQKCLRYWKQWVLRCPPEKRENKNSPYSCKYLKFQQERYVFKEHSRIRLATKSSTHMHILI